MDNAPWRGRTGNRYSLRDTGHNRPPSDPEPSIPFDPLRIQHTSRPSVNRNTCLVEEPSRDIQSEYPILGCRAFVSQSDEKTTIFRVALIFNKTLISPRERAPDKSRHKSIDRINTFFHQNGRAASRYKSYEKAVHALIVALLAWFENYDFPCQGSVDTHGESLLDLQ